MLKQSLAIAIAVVLGAAAVAWASGGERRAAKKPVTLNRLELSCDASTGLVHASVATRLRLPRAASKRLLLLSVKVSRGRLVLAIGRASSKAHSVRSTTGLQHDVVFTQRQSQQIAGAAVGSGECADAQSAKPLLVTLTYTLRGTRVARASRSTQLVVTPGEMENRPGGDDPTGVTQPVTKADWCDALPERAAPSIANDEIDEASGLVASRRHENVLWTHNDSGDSARLFALDGGGETLGTYTLSGATNRDWEDIAIGPKAGSGDYIYVGDIGDNSAIRSYITVYRATEPSERPSGDGSHALASAGSQRLVYPDGARDAETLLVDPLDDSLYVVTKREARSRIYRARPDWDGSTDILEYLGQLAWGGAVAGDVSRDGRLIALKGYLSVRMYDREPGSSLAGTLTGEGRVVPYLPEPQGEALALCGNSGVYVTLSEGLHPLLYSYAP